MSHTKMYRKQSNGSIVYPRYPTIDKVNEPGIRDDV